MTLRQVLDAAFAAALEARREGPAELVRYDLFMHELKTLLAKPCLRIDEASILLDVSFRTASGTWSKEIAV